MIINVLIWQIIAWLIVFIGSILFVVLEASGVLGINQDFVFLGALWGLPAFFFASLYVARRYVCLEDDVPSRGYAWGLAALCTIGLMLPAFVAVSFEESSITSANLIDLFGVSFLASMFLNLLVIRFLVRFFARHLLRKKRGIML